MASIKRNADSASLSQSPASAKKPKTGSRGKPKAEPSSKEYCDSATRRNESGQVVWPARQDQIENVQKIIRECAASNATTVICPDKDADGLSAGAILHHTLTTLGLDSSKIHVHLLPKGETIHYDSQRAQLAALLSDSSSDEFQEQESPNLRYLFVLDHGSARSPALAPPSTTRTLIIDHHSAVDDTFPEHAEWVTAFDCPPVATSALLTYEICKTLRSDLSSPSHRIAWLAVTGTHGDLGTSLKWRDPFPDPTPIFEKASRSAINEAVSLLNAPRRTGTYDVKSAWESILPAELPQDVVSGPKSTRLKEARQEVNAEVARCQAYAPKFSYDSTVALVRIESKCQVHPVIATRWAGTLKSAKKLKYVICANPAYLPGKVNFSCRIAKGANERLAKAHEGNAVVERHTDDEGDGADGEESKVSDVEVNIISELKALAKQHPSGTLLARLGDEFARGHPQASGGIVPEEQFEELISVLRIGEKPAKDASSKNSSPQKSAQKNKLTGYFGKAS
ncbi:MAG: hypothetical protein Q9159_001727 [Coniocarpon cinnabarinum]